MDSPIPSPEQWYPPYDVENLPTWWPQNTQPTGDMARPRLFTPDGVEEVIFPTPILLDSDLSGEPAAKDTMVTAFSNEFERVSLKIVDFSRAILSSH